jgi:hypothetical protein
MARRELEGGVDARASRPRRPPDSDGLRHLKTFAANFNWSTIGADTLQLACQILIHAIPRDPQKTATAEYKPSTPPVPKGIRVTQ